MLTPTFDLSQNDEFLIISIQLPYAKISEIDIHYEDTDFIFYSKPYYLRLNLPGKVLYSVEPTFHYDVEKKVLTVKAEKAERGQLFEGLDLITKLLAPKKNKFTASPMIEVIEGTENSHCDDEEEIDWSLDQKPCEELNVFNIHGDQCGFANSYSFSVFKMKEETKEIFDLEDPQGKQLSLRREERLKAESNHFDEDHYIADLYHDEEIQQLLKYRPEWEDLYDKIQSDSTINSPDDIVQFTYKEKERLQKLPNKEYILEKNQVKVALLSLIDIVFAYAFNKRTTEGENTVESGWTINKLGATLSWVETFSSVHEVAVTCIRRSLCYPLFRHFELSVTVLDDVRKIFLLGRKYVIKCLLEIHEMFCSSEPRYILNDLFITDYCVWMQTKRCSSKQLASLANTLEKILLTKGDIGFNLVDVESFAAIAWMAHNPSAKEFPTPISRDKYISVVENNEKSAEKSTDDLCAGMDNLSFQKKSSDAEDCSDSNTNYRTLGEIFDDYAAGSCSSCTSGSSCSSSYAFESDDSDESDSDGDGSSSSSESEDGSDTTSDSDDGAHRHLLKKENCEKYR